MSILVFLGVLLWWWLVSLQPQPLPQPITVEWTWGGRTGEVFVLERCVVRGHQCVMTPVATFPLSERLYVDTLVLRQRDYCYRIAVQAGSLLEPWSNTLCSS